MKPLMIPEGLLTLRSPEASEAPCDVKCRRLASWNMGFGSTQESHSNSIYICSVCFLRSSAWACNNRSALDRFISQVEETVGQSFSKDAHGNLLESRDADRIVGALVLTSRMFQMQDTLRRAQESI